MKQKVSKTLYAGIIVALSVMVLLVGINTFPGIVFQFSGEPDVIHEGAIHAVEEIYSNVLDMDERHVSKGLAPDSGTGEMELSDNRSTIGPISVESSKSYIFTGNDGITYPLITYYNQDNRYLGHLRVDEWMEHGLTFKTSAETAYIMVSGEDITVTGNEQGTTVENWKLLMIAH